MSHPIEGMLNVSMEKLREMVDVDTVIGKPITTQNGLVTIIPVSKVSFGFGSGGSDIPSNNSAEPFGGGAGAGVTIKPLAFLVIKVGEVELLQLDGSSKGMSKLFECVPEVFSKVVGMVKNKKDKKEKKGSKEEIKN